MRLTRSFPVAAALAATILIVATPAFAGDDNDSSSSTSSSASSSSASQPASSNSDDFDRSAKNVVFLEGLGPALLYSINYERDISDFAVRLGFEYLSISSAASAGSTSTSSTATFIGVPLTLSYLGIGNHKHIFELGAGGTFLYVGGAINTLGNSTSSSAAGAIGTVLLGYRFQPPDGGFFLKVGIAPLFTSFGAFLPWPYLGLGATF
jgi:hypothetical protein